MPDSPSSSHGVLRACHLGETSYREGLGIQGMLVDARARGRTGDWLLLPDHPPVLTVGRSPSPGNLRASPERLARLGVELFEVARGGDITWHGPGQLVGYTIVDMNGRGRDLHRFLRDLEDALIETLDAFGITARRWPGRTGVWAGEEKIASIGIAVRRWVSYHGFALNVAPNLESFELIHPCGLHGIRMTSMAARLGAQAPSLTEVRAAVTHRLAKQLDYGSVQWVPGWQLRSQLAEVADGTREAPAGDGGDLSAAELCELDAEGVHEADAGMPWAGSGGRG